MGPFNDDLYELAAMVEDADLTRASRDELGQWEQRLIEALTLVINSPSHEESLEARLRSAHHAVSRLRTLDVLYTNKAETRLDTVEGRTNKLESRLAEVEKTRDAFQSVRRWATAVFAVVVIANVLILSRGRPVPQQLAIGGIGITVGFLWAWIWRYY